MYEIYMISFAESIILAFVQGITEWLPVSSSAHLSLVSHFFHVESSSVFYVIMLHFATAFVVLFIFQKEFFKMFKAFFRADFKSEYGKKALFLIIATLPVAVLGVFLESIFEKIYLNINLIGLFLLLTGLFLFLVEKFPRGLALNYKNTFIIGLSQIISVFPGISRSGITLGTGLLLGIKKEEAAKFSFMLGVPLLLGAGLFQLIFSPFSIDIEFFPLIIGIIVTMVTSYFSIKFLLKVIMKEKLWYFGIYCFLISLLVLVFG